MPSETKRHPISPSRAFFSPWALSQQIWSNRTLILRLSRRELEARVRGSMLGLAWIVFQPVLMLCVYTFAFGVVFKARWGGAEAGSPLDYAIFLFCGLLIFNVFAENISRAPSLLQENPSYIKSVVFPLEVLPVVTVLVSLFNFLVGLFVLLVLQVLVMGLPPITMLLVPFLLLPLMLLVLGLSWFLASLGMYLRDLRQVVAIVVTAALFLSPVFYPLSATPEVLRLVMTLNPLAPIIESARGLVLVGEGINWGLYGLGVALSALFAWLGLVFFLKLRSGFADVI